MSGVGFLGTPISRMGNIAHRVLVHAAAKPLLFALCLGPLAWMLWAAVSNQLGANPAEALIRSSGDWALRALCLALAVTPLRELTRMAALARFRRMVGLFAFFYALLHFLAYLAFDQGFDLGEVLRDVAQRPFILVGSLALLVLAALAATSPQRAVRALGGHRWKALHRTVHLAAALALLHFYWMRSGKNDVAEVAWYAGLLALLWAWRLRPRGR